MQGSGLWNRLKISWTVFAIVFLHCVSPTPVLAETPTIGTRQAGEDWPAFLGPRGDGTSAEKGVDPELWKPHPPIKWTMELGVSYGGPTIVKGRLLQFDRFGDDERLTCFNAETAEELWRAETKVVYEDLLGYNNGPRCSPIVDGDNVYTFGVNGQLTCWRLDDGQQIWQKDTAKEFSVVQNFFGVASTPYVYNDLLLVMIGGSPPESHLVPAGQLDRIKPNGSAVVAFNKLTGKEVYRVGNDLSSYASMTVREINGKATGLAFLRSGLMAWDPESGKEIFKFPWRASMRDSVNAALPVMRGNQILITEAYEIGSALLSVAGGKPKPVWQDTGTSVRKHAFRAHWSTPVWVGDYLYGCSGRNQPDADFRCIRMSDGKLQWTERRHERSSVLLVDGYLIVLGEYGRLELVRTNPEKFDVVATANLNQIADPTDKQALLEYPCWAAPVLSHGLLYIRGMDRLICMELIPQ